MAGRDFVPGFLKRRIFNVEVLVPKGKRFVATATNIELGVMTTIVISCNATGSYVPPVMIFKHKRRREGL